MGFLDGVGRMIAGKPVFEAQNDAAELSPSDNDSVDSHKTPVDDRGRKVIPEVTVTHVKPHISGPNMEVWATVQNASDVTIYLDKIHILGQKLELDRELTARASHQYRLYKGAVFRSKPSHDADIEYRLQASGDYFRARFDLEFDYQNGLYVPEDFHPEHPIQDI